MRAEPLEYSTVMVGFTSLIFQTFRQSWNLGATTLSITTLSIMTLSKMTFSITINET